LDITIPTAAPYLSDNVGIRKYHNWASRKYFLCQGIKEIIFTR
jgi:hypothetical protein